MSEDDALLRLTDNLSTIIASGELPIFLDDGGLLDNDGYFLPHIRKLLDAIAQNEDIYLFIVSNRRPNITETYCQTIQLNRLPEKETKRLISELARIEKLQLSMDDIEELAGYIAGYPPAAYFAITKTKAYGIKALLKDKQTLVEFRAGVFIKEFARLYLSEVEKKLLVILSIYSPLPINTVVAVLGLNDTEAVKVVLRLMDYSFITMTDEGHYRIAEPISDSIINTFGLPKESHSKEVAEFLTKYLSDDQLDVKRLEISRVLFRAAKISKDRDAEKLSIHLVSDLVKLTESSYHARYYDEAISFGKAVLEERPDDATARGFLIRSYIQKEMWSKAEGEIERLAKDHSMKEVYFLKGFLERKRLNTSLALRHYMEAERHGRSGIAIKREMASCHLHNGNIDEAYESIIMVVDGPHGDNPFIIDMWAEIVLKKQDDTEIEKALSRLKVLDEARYYFRLSKYNVAKGQYIDAVHSAKKSLESSRPPFKFHGQLVFSLIRSKNYKEALKKLNELDRKFKDVEHDVRLLLRCLLNNCLRNFKEALRLSENIINKEKMYYKKIRRDAVEGELETSALPDAERARLKAELNQLNSEVSQDSLDDLSLN